MSDVSSISDKNNEEEKFANALDFENTKNFSFAFFWENN